MKCLLCSNLMQKTVAEQHLDEYLCERCGYRISDRYSRKLDQICVLRNDSMHYGICLISRNRAINWTIVYSNSTVCFQINRYINDEEFTVMCKRYKRLQVMA